MTQDERINELQWRLDGAAAEAAEAGHDLEVTLMDIEPDYPPWDEWGATDGKEAAERAFEDENAGLEPWR